MKLNLNKSALISISLLLVLSSCGKSKDLKTDSAPASPAPTSESTPAPEAQKTPETKTPDTKTPEKTPAPVKPAPKGPTTPIQPPTDTEGDGGPTLVPTQPQSAVNNDGSDIEVLPPLPMAPHKAPGEQSSVLNPPLANVSLEDERAYQIDFTKQVAVKTGGQTNDLFYTGAGKDGVLNEFKSYTLKVSKDQQAMNANLAKAVVTAKLSRQTSTGEVYITMTFNEFGALKTYRLKASQARDMMTLSSAQSGSTGEMAFQGGFLKCLDQGGGCETAYAKMKFAGGYTRVIFRNSLSDMHFQYQNNVTGNPGFNTWVKYITNTSGEVPVQQVFDSLQLSSFEVVNGRAGMGALLTTLDREMIGLSIPLVVSAQGSEVSAAVSKLSDLSANYDLAPLSHSYSQNLSQKISAVKLIKNNGLGQLKLNLSIGNANVWIVAARVQKPLISLQQLRTFESQVKNF